MRFVDEVVINITAGKGGDGCLSFHREKFVPRGGPDGGNGGRGGSVYMISRANLNTLVDYRYHRIFKAQNGSSGGGKERSGKAGEDIILEVPIGTLVRDNETGEKLAEFLEADEKVCLSNGGKGGLGNAVFKTSTNRAPRKITKGEVVEEIELKIELQVLADVGLLGLPNAGKSSFLRKVSNATPKVADYPFTTLYPVLGSVSLDKYNDFVIADLPGLIEGSSEGLGLGVRFLKHLTRVKTMIHIIDITSSTIKQDFKLIRNELLSFSKEFEDKPYILVFNKIDALSEPEIQEKKKEIKKMFPKKKIFYISALLGSGVDELLDDIRNQLII